MNYYSTGTCTLNGDGMFEVNMEYENGLMRGLFNKSRVKEVWVNHDGVAWLNKDTKKEASYKKVMEIIRIKSYHFQWSAITDTMEIEANTKSFWNGWSCASGEDNDK